MNKLFIFFICCAFSLKLHAQSAAETEIRQLLQKQTTAWNKGDIDLFMETYWKSDSLIFVGKNGVTYGWKNTLENYKKNYPGKAAMGQLQFHIIKIEALTPASYNVIGKWHLTRAAGDLQGHYTLIIRKIDGVWQIVQDHSS